MEGGAHIGKIVLIDALRPHPAGTGAALPCIGNCSRVP